MSYVSYVNLGFQGALGNQLWEIAGTVGIAEQSAAKPAFPFWAYQAYFDVPDEWFVPSDFYFDEQAVHDLGEDYLQDMSHWSTSGMRIWDAFQPSEFAQSLIQARHGDDMDTISDVTSVHVRRGNNVTPQYASHHPVMPLEYFEEAMELTGGPFRIFSDSPEWCKQQSLFRGCEFGLGPPPELDVMELTKYHPTPSSDAAIDLLTMSYSRRIIMSNSSFSWWSAFLSGPGSQVIYPKQWYGAPLAHIDTSVMFNRLWASDWTAI